MRLARGKRMKKLGWTEVISRAPPALIVAGLLRHDTAALQPDRRHMHFLVLTSWTTSRSQGPVAC
nr:hypothetical protein BDOA9_0130150 [Bradyrhizobium sp. DOA9]